MPVILATVGSTTVETGLLALQRPFLASVLGLASPAVNPIRTFAYNDVLGTLRKRVSLARPPHFLSRRAWLQNLLQYTSAVAALTNLVLVAVDLTRKTIIANDPNRDYQVTVWALWAFGIHVFGSAAVMLRFRLESHPTAQTISKPQNLLATIKKHIRTEFTPSTIMAPSRIAVRSEPKNAWLWLFLSWFVSIATVVHIVFGTLIFSNILFIASGDALGVLMRCLASVSVCRIILMFELNEMGRHVTVEKRGLDLDSHLGKERRVSRDTLELDQYRGSSLTVPDTSYTRLVS